ncbi:MULTISPECIES: HAD family hydrolase [unclassified Schlesneria]|uniref:HAD family hydrolase n=1 Tax=unclassified Schlesneria TaxID=2762017 RepID=UPI002EEC0F47
MTETIPQIQAVCFDLDGLMFNTEDVFYVSADVLLQRRGLRMSKGAMDAMLGLRPLESLTAFRDYMKLNEEPADLLAESRVIFHEMLNEHLRPMPGLYDLLNLIESRKLPKGVATSSPRDYLDDIFERFELGHRFPVKLTAESVTHGKPNPEIYLKAAELLGVRPENMLVLEDSGTGSRAAAAAGAFIVSVPHDHTASHDFSRSKHIAKGLNDPFIWNLLS